MLHQDEEVSSLEIDTTALLVFLQEVECQPSAGLANFGVETTWKGGTRTVAKTLPIQLGPNSIDRAFEIAADEPRELLGTNTAANPQELLLAALNACVAATFVVNAAAMGIPLQSLVLSTSGTLDLRGFLGLDATVNPGYDSVACVVKVESSANRERLEELYEKVRKTSPNFHNFVRAIDLRTELITA